MASNDGPGAVSARIDAAVQRCPFWTRRFLSVVSAARAVRRRRGARVYGTGMVGLILRRLARP